MSLITNRAVLAQAQCHRMAGRRAEAPHTASRESAEEEGSSMEQAGRGTETEELFWAQVRIYSWTRVHWIHGEVSPQALSRNRVFWTAVKQRMAGWDETHLLPRDGGGSTESQCFAPQISSILESRQALSRDSVPLGRVRASLWVSSQPKPSDPDCVAPSEAETIVQMFEHMVASRPSGLQFRKWTDQSLLHQSSPRMHHQAPTQMTMLGTPPKGRAPDSELHEVYERAEQSDRWLFLQPAYEALATLPDCPVAQSKGLKRVLKQSPLAGDVVRLMHLSTHPAEQGVLRELAYQLYAKLSYLRKSMQRVVMEELENARCRSHEPPNGLGNLLELYNIGLGKQLSAAALALQDPVVLLYLRCVAPLYTSPWLPSLASDLAPLTRKISAACPALRGMLLARILASWPWCDSAAQAVLLAELPALLAGADETGDTEGVDWLRLWRVVKGCTHTDSGRVLEALNDLLRCQVWREGLVLHVGFHAITDLEVRVAHRVGLQQRNPAALERERQAVESRVRREAVWDLLAECVHGKSWQQRPLQSCFAVHDKKYST